MYGTSSLPRPRQSQPTSKPFSLVPYACSESGGHEYDFPAGKNSVRQLKVEESWGVSSSTTFSAVLSMNVTHGLINYKDTKANVVILKY
jgi:hypothetical protein